MFTGLVEAKGSLVRRIDRGGEARLVIQGDLVGTRDPLVLGESIAIDGVCLTVDQIVQPAGPSIFVPSNTCEAASIGCPASRLRHNATPSKFSSEKPIGSISA